MTQQERKWDLDQDAQVRLSLPPVMLILSIVPIPVYHCVHALLCTAGDECQLCYSFQTKRGILWEVY